TSATSYDNASELTSATLSAVTTNYTYDDDGNRTQAAHGMTTTINATNNAAANMSAATYDGDGLRATATTTPTGGSSNTQAFTWDPTGSVPHLLMDSDNAYIYGPGNTPLEQIDLSSGTSNYLVADLLGSVRGIVSNTGSLTASTSYDAWGNPQTTGGLTAASPFGYAGSYTDPTGLTYNINRYYDSSTGQFLTVDPLVEATGQPYAYVNGDPVNGVDPLGLGCGIFNPGGCIRGAASAVVGAVGTATYAVAHAANAVLPAVHEIAGDVAGLAGICAAVSSETAVGGVACGSIAVIAGGVNASTGLILNAEGKLSTTSAVLGATSLEVGGLGEVARMGKTAALGRGAAAR